MRDDRAYQRLIGALRGADSGPKLELHIVGITGTEGAALARLLSGRLGSRARIVGHDFSPRLRASFDKAHVALPRGERGARFEELLALPGLELRVGDRYLEGIEAAELVFAGQNWRAYPANDPKLFEAQRRLPFAQMVDLYLDLAPCALAAITGTNGKTTTCNWLKAMAESERPARVSGNDLFSQQSLGELFTLAPESLLILEVSNRQARDLRRSAPVVGVTSLAPDHVQEHGGYEAYLAAKRRLVELQTAADTTVLNRDNAEVRKYAEAASGEVLWVSATTLEAGLEGAYAGKDGALRLRVDGEDRFLSRRSELRLPGEHNLRNALVAALCGLRSGLSLEALRRGLREFRGVKNRLQWIAAVEGAQYYNDLASTTPWATLAALRAFAPGGLQVIIGGAAKAEDGYRELAEELGRRARRVIAFPGGVSERVLAALPPGCSARRVASIDEAVRLAAGAARPGEQVLLSPAGAGFYSNFLGKAGSFNRSVRRLGRRGRVA